jgi:hypothetical protein
VIRDELENTTKDPRSFYTFSYVTCPMNNTVYCRVGTVVVMTDDDKGSKCEAIQ